MNSLKQSVNRLEERGHELENSEEIPEKHESRAHEGQTATPDLQSDVDFHFVAFVQKNGRLYELNGNKQGPVDHGNTSPSAFLSNAAATCRSIMSQNPECLTFTAVALSRLSEQ